MVTNKQISKAKQVLKDAGYYTDNLWTVSDVKIKFDCTDEQAQGVLNKALNNDATIEQIWFAIDMIGGNENLVSIKEKELLMLNDFNQTFFMELKTFMEIEIYLNDESSDNITKKERKEFYSRWK